jgi:hypothetical protein
MRNIIGLDLGQARDPSALCLLQEAPKDKRINWEVPALRRWQLGTSYPAIVADVGKLVTKLNKPTLVVDGTGVGRAVVDIFRLAALPLSALVVVTITGGHTVHQTERDSFSVPKKDLVAVTQAVLQAKRLKVSPQLPDAKVLERELQNFKVKITTAANEQFEAWREGDHDDLVLSAALALWYAERGQRVAKAVYFPLTGDNNYDPDTGTTWKRLNW